MKKASREVKPKKKERQVLMKKASREVKPTYEGKTKWPLYKHPVLDEDREKEETVNVRLWLFKNLYAVTHIKDKIIVYFYSEEIPIRTADDFAELNYYMVKEKYYIYKTEKTLDTILKRTEKRKRFGDIL